MSSKKNKAQAQPNPRTQEKQSAKQSAPSFYQGIDYILLGAIIVLVYAIFHNTLGHEFVNWDDDRNFYENPMITNIAEGNFWQQAKIIFSNPVIGNYNPLAIFSFAIDKVWFGLDNPRAWHLENVLFHIGCALLVYAIGRRLGLSSVAAFIFSLIFGIHPMRVESVAWVTERKDVLFGIFYLGALLQYIKYKADQKSSRWIWIALFFTLSLFSKIQAVSLPLSMLAVDYFLNGKLEWKDIFNKAPWFLMSLFFGILGIYMLKSEGSLDVNATIYPFWQRLFIGSYSLMVYLIKFFAPYRLSPLYPYPNTLPITFYLSMIPALAFAASLIWGYLKNWRVYTFGGLFFLVNIVFLLQILGAGQGFIADRFSYIAYIGLAFPVVYYLDQWQKEPSKRWPVLGGAGAVFAIFAFMTIQQNKIWANSGTLWTHVLQYYNNTTLPYGNRANYYRSNGQKEKALADYNAAIALKKDPQTFNSRARLFFDLAKSRDSILLALADYDEAIRLKPGDGEFHVNRGATYARLGDLDKALEDISTGLKFKPDHGVGYLNRSVIYNMKGDYQNALTDLETYVKIVPNNPDIWYEMARAKRLLNRSPEAIPDYDMAIKLDKTRGLFYYERANTYYVLGQMDKAKTDLQMAISLGYKEVNPQFKAQLGL